MTYHNLTTHDDLESLLGAYALDALDPDEAEAVEAHLAECPRCASEVAIHRNTASLLAATVSGEAPPHLWDRIAAELEEEAPAPRELFPERPAVADPHAPPAKIVSLSRRRRAVPIVSAVAAVAAAAAIVLGVNASHLNHRVNTLSHAVAAGGLQQAAAAALLNPQHQTVQLDSASSVAGHSTGQVVVLPDGTAYWVRSNLPTLDAARTYQLWGLSGGKAVSLTLLGTNPQLAAFRVEPGVTRLMVTAEPKGGVPQPTTAVLIQGNLPA